MGVLKCRKDKHYVEIMTVEVKCRLKKKFVRGVYFAVKEPSFAINYYPCTNALVSQKR